MRTAYQLTAACLSGAGLSPMARAYADHRRRRSACGLVRHLDQFKLFLLGAALLRGADARDLASRGNASSSAVRA